VPHDLEKKGVSAMVVKSRQSAIPLLSLIMSMKPCCIMLWLASITGATASGSSQWAPLAGKIILPFVAWPLLLWSYKQAYEGIRWMREHPKEINWPRAYMHWMLIVFSTGTFGYFLITDFVPFVMKAGSSCCSR
jgi:hypothetical protein